MRDGRLSLRAGRTKSLGKESLGGAVPELARQSRSVDSEFRRLLALVHTVTRGQVSAEEWGAIFYSARTVRDGMQWAMLEYQTYTHKPLCVAQKGKADAVLQRPLVRAWGP